jgi:hypothetical protein
MVNKDKILEGYERLNKHELIDACVLIEHDIDVDRMVSEVAGIPKKAWPGPANRLGVHSNAQAIFLRGYAPLQRLRQPIEDRGILDTLPYIRSLIRSISSKPMRCVLAKLRAGQRIPVHVDIGKIIVRTIRIHIPVVTSGQVVMQCNNRRYNMKVGEMWVINNGAEHAVYNNDPVVDRIHMICDYLPEPGLLERLAIGRRLAF